MLLVLLLFTCYDSEVTWELYDSLSGGGAFALSGGAPFSYASENCVISGCTDATAANFDPNATEDDGSCISLCEACADSGGLFCGDDQL